jgi:hypothetical protein
MPKIGAALITVFAQASIASEKFRPMTKMVSSSNLK